MSRYSRLESTIGGVEIPDSAVDSFIEDFLGGLEEKMAQGPELTQRFRIIETRKTAKLRQALDNVRRKELTPRYDKESNFLREQGMLPGYYGRYSKRKLW